MLRYPFPILKRRRANCEDGLKQKEVLRGMHPSGLEKDATQGIFQGSLDRLINQLSYHATPDPLWCLATFDTDMTLLTFHCC